MSWVGTFILRHDANGGSPTPGNAVFQRVFEDAVLSFTSGVNVSSTRPTRTGYDFKSWGGRSPGSDYTFTLSPSNSSQTVTLTAVWSRKTYKIKYDANGGSGAPAEQTKTYGTALTLSSTKPTRAGYAFASWNTKADGSGTSYAAGASYTSNAAATLYAQWNKIATITISGTGYINAAQTISIGGKGQSGDTVAIKASFGTGSNLSVYSGTGSSYSWTPSNYGQYIPSAMSGTCTLTVTTSRGGVTLGSSTYTYTLKIPSYTPTVSVTWAETVSGLNAKFGCFVQNQSKIKGTITAASNYGGSISSYAAYVNGSNYSSATFTTKVFGTAGNNAYSITVTDSRGRSKTITGNIAIVSYSYPSLKVAAVRTNGDTSIDVTVKPSISPVNNNNDKGLKIEYKRSQDSSWITLFNGNFSSYTGQETKTISVVDIDSVYNIRCTATDYFTSSVKEATVSSADPIVLRVDSITKDVQFLHKILDRIGVEVNGGIARKNLLDNWYFLRPVNQRGKSTYQGSGIVYTIDRWMTAQNYPISVGADGLTLNNNTNNIAYLHQRFDCDLTEALLGKTLTISIVKADGTAYSGSAKMPINLPASATTEISVSAGGISVYFVLNSSGQSYGSRFTISIPAGVSTTVAACKLEIGASQTLWYNDNGNVVLTEIPDYGEQLRRCRRYYTVLNGSSVVYLDFGGFVTSNTNVYVNTGIEEMRDTPSVTFTGGIIIRGVNGYSTDASYSNPCTNPAVTALNNGFALVFKKADSSAWGGLASNTPVGLTNTAGTKIELTADL